MRDHAIAMEEDDVVPLVTVEGDDVTLVFEHHSLEYVVPCLCAAMDWRQRQIPSGVVRARGATPTTHATHQSVLINHPMIKSYRKKGVT